jgi:hypothetical protein
MDDIILVNGVRYHAEKQKDEHPWVIVRSAEAGVFFGELAERNDGNTVLLHSSRRLWYWSGAASLSELSVKGVKNPSECKFPIAVEDHEIFGVCEILQVTEEAKKSIDSVPVWSA